MASVSAAPRPALSPASPVSSPVSRSSATPEQAAFVDPLAGVPEALRTPLWQGFLRALEPVIWEHLPPPPRRILPPWVLEQLDERFTEVLACWHLWQTVQEVWRAEFWHAADMLEALILKDDEQTYLPLLTACCTRIGQLYRLVEQWDGRPFAQSMFEWELRLLRSYRESWVIPPMLFREFYRDQTDE